MLDAIALGKSLIRLNGEDVLMLHDVLGRRGWVREMGRIVERFGGKSAAVVTPIMISPDLILTELSTQQRPELRVANKPAQTIRVHSLVHFPIRELVGSTKTKGLFTLDELFQLNSASSSITLCQSDVPFSLIQSVDYYVDRAIESLIGIVDSYKLTLRTRPLCVPWQRIADLR